MRHFRWREQVGQKYRSMKPHGLGGNCSLISFAAVQSMSWGLPGNKAKDTVIGWSPSSYSQPDPVRDGLPSI